MRGGGRSGWCLYSGDIGERERVRESQVVECVIIEKGRGRDRGQEEMCGGGTKEIYVSRKEASKGGNLTLSEFRWKY